MNPKEQILNFIKGVYQKKTKSVSPDKSEELESAASPEDEIIQELFDGMSTGTARIIIEREVSQDEGTEAWR